MAHQCLVFDHQPLGSVIGVVLVKVGLIHLEAGNVQRLCQLDVALLPCGVCRCAESLYPVPQLGQVSRLPCPHALRLTARLCLALPLKACWIFYDGKPSRDGSSRDDSEDRRLRILTTLVDAGSVETERFDHVTIARSSFPVRSMIISAKNLPNHLTRRRHRGS
jgi:hypothetical protein